MRILFVIFLTLFLVTKIYFVIVADESKLAPNITDETWDWMPEWRDRADCGPNALYVLMKLEGCNVTLEQVKNLVPLDPVKGCSMESLIHASEKLGFPVEARFAKPSDISKIPRPFILHGITSQEKNIGHFVVVVDFDKKKNIYALIDPIRETYGWNPESSLLYGYSGYILIPCYPSIRKWNIISGLALIICGIGVLIIVYRKKRKKLNATFVTH
ncbi:MAG: hypothetical protein LBQ66_06905 [Planctomycetaceae bacterium]|jgi:hypothetical protein|nr:hypothetical protein [Planctomycetaceae bacterium]